MPNIQSAKKKLRKSIKQRAYNRVHKDKVKIAMKNVLKAVADKDKEKAASSLQTYFKLIDKSVQKNVFHRNYAARRKSILAIKVNTIA